MLNTTTITSPKTGKEVKVLTWDIAPREILADMKAGKIRSARDISYQLLNERTSYRKMQREQYGDSASTNFALRIFEQALDWSLGLAVLRFIQSASRGHLPKPFKVAVTRGGDVFIVGASGRIYNW